MSPMTSYLLRLVDAGEIVALRVECLACGIEVRVPLRATVDRELRCPRCGTPFKSPGADLSVGDVARQLHTLLKQFFAGPNNHFTARLVIETQSDDDSPIDPKIERAANELVKSMIENTRQRFLDAK